MLRFKHLTYLSILLLSSIVFFSSCNKNDDPVGPPPVVKPNLIFFGVTPTNQIIKYNANASNAPLSSANITGLQPGETILGMDFRPATGELYALGST